MLRTRVEARRENGSGATSFNDISGELEHPERSILFHDGNNRSMEQLMSDQAKNALLHNMVVELLKKQYGAMESALRERVT
jgi:flagellar basal body rod protein FlgB